MVAIQGISGIPEPKPERSAKVRDAVERDEASNVSRAQDGVVISSEAQAAAKITQLLQSATLSQDMRAERVEAARERIDRGEYKDPAVVAQVAKKISKYLP